MFLCFDLKAHFRRELLKATVNCSQILFVYQAINAGPYEDEQPFRDCHRAVNLHPDFMLPPGGLRIDDVSPSRNTLRQAGQPPQHFLSVGSRLKGSVDVSLKMAWHFVPELGYFGAINHKLPKCAVLSLAHGIDALNLNLI